MGWNLDNLPPKLRQQIQEQCLRAHETEPQRRTPREAEKESDLHEKIEEYCRAQGWYYIHSRLDKRTSVAVGCPDWCIALPSGKVIWLECKRPGGKPTPAQNAALAQLRKLGHHAEVVRTCEETLAAINSVLEQQTQRNT